MKFTTMFGALALTAALSATAFGDTVKSDNFEGWDISDATEVDPYGYPQKPVNTITGFETKDAAGNGWTVNGGEEDQSAIVATHFEGGGKALRLNTNGSTLEFKAATEDKYEATVEMKVQMVASDTEVNMDTDTETHTALYLHKVEDGENADTVLRAFGYDAVAEKNKWYDLAVSGVVTSNVVVDGATADVVITMDYDAGYATYTINNVTYDRIMMANKNAAQGRSSLHSVAFKGTGYVDDLFVKQRQTGIYADFIYEIAGLTGAGENEPDNGEVSSDNLNIEDLDYTTGVDAITGYDVTVTLVERVEGEDDDLLATLTVTNGEISFDETVANFEEGHTYVVVATYALKSVTVNIVDDNDAVIATDTSKKWFEPFSYTLPAGASISGWSVGQDDYEEEDPIAIASLEADVVTIVLHDYDAGQSGTKTWTTDDVVAGSFSWTGYDPAAGTATFTCTLSGIPGQNDSFGSFTVTTVTALGGSTTDQPVTVTPDLTALPTLTGTVSGLPTGGNSLFLLGVKDAAAAGE